MGELRQVWRGYDPVQVQVGFSVLEVENDRLRQRLADAKEELDYLRSARSEASEDGDGEVARALILAQRAADAVREDALLDAAVTRRHTEAELMSVRNDIDASKRQLGDLRATQISLRDETASPVATRIAFIIDGADGVGDDSAAAQRMLEFAELLHAGPRGEPAEGAAVPRKVEVPARVRPTPAAKAETVELRQSEESRPSVPPAGHQRPLATAAAAVVSEPGDGTVPDEPDVPAPAEHKALATTAESVNKPPLATRRKRVIRKSADQPVEV